MKYQTLTIEHNGKTQIIDLPKGVYAKQERVFSDVRLITYNGDKEVDLGMASRYTQGRFEGAYFAVCEFIPSDGKRLALEFAGSLYDAISWLIVQIKHQYRPTQ